MPPRPDLLTRVTSRHLQAHGVPMGKDAGADDVMGLIIPVRDLVKLVDSLEDAGDAQSADLAHAVYQALDRKLRLSDSEVHALNRLKGSVQRLGEWDAGTQRNNIFKAANLLGMKLPSYMFASQKTAGTIYESLELSYWPNISNRVEGALQDIQAEERELRDRARAIQRAWDRSDVDALVRLDVFTAQERDLMRQAWEALQNHGDDRDAMAHGEDASTDILARIASEENKQLRGISRLVR